MSRKRKILYSILAIIIACIALVVWQLDIFNWQRLDISRITGLELSTRVYAADGSEAGTLSGAVAREYVPLGALPEYVPQAFIAAEDARFYSHSGVDIRRIFGAMWQNIKSFSFAQGASTITQQLIKLTHLTSEKTLARKAQEAYLALQLEKTLSKDEILEAYLNTVYFGGGAYGVGAAAQRYFGKDATELTLAEASLLAGVIKSPSSYAPHINPEAALERREYVLSSMAREGFISAAEAEHAHNSPLEIIEETDAGVRFGWYMDEAAREAADKLGISYDELLGGGYSIYTGLDMTVQSAAEEVMASDAYYPEAAAQGALVAMDPATGEITAIVGGREYATQLGLNRAVSARRQPGSLIKPISTYSAAVERYGYVPTSTVYDVQREYPGGYMPGNSGGTYNGEVTLRQALARSMNAATVDLADTMGVNAITSQAAAFGIPVDESDKNLALALGAMTYGATPVEMCAAYGALANGGMLNSAHCVRRIVDRYGVTVYEYNGEASRAVSAESAYIITDMLKTAVNSGTARALGSLGMPVAAKTGTAGLDNGDTSDAWATAYTPDIAITVWIGRDSNAEGGMPAATSGSGYAVPACAELLSRIRGMLSGSDFAMPDGLNRMLIDGYALDSENRVMLASGNTPAEYVRTELFHTDAHLEMSDIWEAPAQVSELRIISGDGETPILQFTGSSGYTEYVVVRKSRGVTEIAGVAQGEPGATIHFTDTAADVSQVNTYSVIPRHALLYELGYTLTGAESGRVSSDPGGLLNDLAELFNSDADAPDIESITDPLF